MLRTFAYTLCLTYILIGCSRFTPPERPTIDVISIEPGSGLGANGQALVTHPRFAGLNDLVAGDGWLKVGWAQATDDLTPHELIEYLIYMSPRGTPINFANPTEIVTGETHSMIEGLVNGQTWNVVVLARDEDNEVSPKFPSWPATPHPVRYIRSGNSTAGANGLTPASAFPTMGAAIASSIPLGGVNLHVAEGLYPENLFLLPGMMVFGGFEESFDPLTRNPDELLTQFGILFSTDLVNLRPGEALNGIDGLSLAGNGIAESCVFAEDSFSRITRCQLSGAITQGMDLRSDFLEGNVIEVLVANCLITNCNGEGLRIVGIPEIRIDNSEIRNNLNEGIESQWIYSGFDKQAKIEITRCNIFNNGDEGIDLDLAAVPPLIPGAIEESSTRVKIRNCRISGNALEGIVIDVDSTPSDSTDIRVRIDDSLINDNGATGLFLDGDAPAAFRISRCQISANGADGLLVSSIPNGSQPQVRNCNIIGNAGFGIATLDLCSIFATNCWLEGNLLGPLQADRGQIALQDSIASDFASHADFSNLQYCLISGSNLPLDLPNQSQVGIAQILASPSQYTRGQILPNGNLLADIPLNLTPGATVEICDDGQLRSCSLLQGGQYSLDPAPSIASASVAVFVWNQDQGPDEDSTPLPGTLAENGGNPFVTGLDGFPENLGPSGNNPLSFVGPDPALADPPRNTELISITPSPATPLTTDTLTLVFTRPFSLNIKNSARIYVNGVDQSDFQTLMINDNQLQLQLDGLVDGDDCEIRLLPYSGLENGSDVYRVIRHRVGTHIDEDINLDALNDSLETTPLFSGGSFRIQGSLSTSSDIDWIRVQLPTTNPVRVEALAKRISSLLTPVLSQYSADGSEIIQTRQATPPFFFDPFFVEAGPDTNGVLVLRVSCSDSTLIGPLEYDLIIQP